MTSRNTANFSFYQQYTTVPTKIINKILPMKPLKGQPGSIHMMSVNGRDMAFLGNGVPQYDKLLRQSYRVDKMAIPLGAQQVNPDVLVKQLGPLRTFDPNLSNPASYEQDPGPQNTKAIDIDQDGFFFGEKLKENIMLDVVGMVSPVLDTKRHFHHCFNYTPEAKSDNATSLTRGDSSLNANDCGTGHLFPSIVDGKVRSNLTLFYIRKLDFAAAWIFEFVRAVEAGIIKPGTGDTHTIGTLEGAYLIPYFDLVGLEVDWDTVEGVFLIPVLFPDDRIIYLCLLNRAGYSNQEIPIAEHLRVWCEAVAAVNEDPAERELFVAANDNFYTAVDPWSIILAQNAGPVVGDRTNILMPDVLNGIKQIV